MLFFDINCGHEMCSVFLKKSMKSISGSNTVFSKETLFLRDLATEFIYNPLFFSQSTAFLNPVFILLYFLFTFSFVIFLYPDYLESPLLLFLERTR